jgi:MFS family permease
MLISGTGIAIWGVLPYLDKGAFIAISFIGRILMGLGQVFIIVASMTIAASDYPDRVGKVLSYIDGCGGLGLISGPLIGAGLYAAAGFSVTFFVYASLFFVATPGIYFLLGPDRPYVKQQKEKMSIWVFNRKPLVLVQLLCCLWIMSLISGLDAVMAVFLDSTYGFHNSIIGVIYAIMTVAYTAASLVSGHIVNKMNKPWMCFVGVVTGGIAFLFVGPCVYCGMPESYGFTFAGLALVGAGNSICYIPLMPLMIELATTVYGFANDDILTDTLSSSFMMYLNIGNIVGPLSYGIITEFWTFQNTFSTIGFISLGFSILYLLFSVGLRGSKTVDDEKEKEISLIENDSSSDQSSSGLKVNK